MIRIVPAKIKIRFFAQYLLVCVMLSGCSTIPDIGTRVYVYDRVNRVQFGNTADQVIYLLDGQPSYVTTMQQGADTFELWEYQVGNFLNAQAVMILFQNGRVAAIPKNEHELLKTLKGYGLVNDATFWNVTKNRAE